MNLYRISRCNFINDLSGTGSRLYGGRWNSVGVPLIYFASSRSLALLETLFHLPAVLLPPDLCLLEVEVTTQSIEIISVADLPENWKSYPEPDTLKAFGNNFFKKKDHLILKVPSAIVSQEYNYLLNPAHTEIKNLKIIQSGPFVLDKRLH